MTLTEAMASLGFTPAQMAELEADDERAWGWILWARGETKLKNPAGMILTKFRSGADAPDPNAWRGEKSHRGPDYPALLRCAEALVRSTGHEYREEDLAAELERLGGMARVGNGATLTDKDLRRLLAESTARRKRWETERDSSSRRARWLAEKKRRSRGERVHDDDAHQRLGPREALLELLREAADLPCADCHEERPLVTYGSERVCRGCAEKRDLAAVAVEF